MQQTLSEESITLNINNKEEHMPLEVYARWLSLLEGIEFVGKRMEQLKKRAGTPSEVDWIKPLAFQKYIDERFASMKSDLIELEKNKEQL
jgi:hypothetical protein